MNQSFIQMLRFEYKSNAMMWLFNLIIGAGLLTTLYFQGNNHDSNSPIFIFPVYLFLIWVFTINSYQESTKSQSMQMYHLIPVSRNTKYFSKQFITLFAYPLALAILTTLFIGIFRLFLITPDIFHESNSVIHKPGSINLTSQYLLVIWLFGHSVSTFFAVIFKKNKILYAFLISLAFQFILSISFAIYVSTLNFKNGDRVHGFFPNYDFGVWSVILPLFISAIFYCITYHLFFRRQL